MLYTLDLTANPPVPVPHVGTPGEHFDWLEQNREARIIAEEAVGPMNIFGMMTAFYGQPGRMFATTSIWGRQLGLAGTWAEAEAMHHRIVEEARANDMQERTATGKDVGF